MYTVGETGTLYTGQGQYYATTGGHGAAAVGYSTTPAHYLVQPAADDILAQSQRTSPQTTAAVSTLTLPLILTH